MTFGIDHLFLNGYNIDMFRCVLARLMGKSCHILFLFYYYCMCMCYADFFKIILLKVQSFISIFFSKFNYKGSN